MDPTLPIQVKDFLSAGLNMKELTCFDMLNNDPDENTYAESACLLSYPHFDPLIEFRGLGENLLPFHKTLWKDFKTSLIEASGSWKTVSLKKYLNDLCNYVDLKLILLIPWIEDSGMLLADNPIKAYEALENFRQEFSKISPDPSVELLLISAGGDPFDESLSRALSVFLNCLRQCSCKRVILTAEGSKGLGLDPELILKNNVELEMPLILRYVNLCKNLLKDRTVYVVSAIPESLLKMVLDCRAYETLSDAYRASRLFLPRGSRTGIVTHASLVASRPDEAKTVERE